MAAIEMNLGDDENKDQDQEDIAWAAASGRRLADAKTFFSKATTPTRLVLMLLCLRPVFSITHWLLGRAEGSKELSQPALWDWLEPQTSPVIRAMQELSHLVASDTPAVKARKG